MSFIMRSISQFFCTNCTMQFRERNMDFIVELTRKFIWTILNGVGSICCVYLFLKCIVQFG